MNTKHTKIQLSMITLTVLSAVFYSRSLASDDWMQRAPMRLGEGQVASIAFSSNGTILFAANRTDSSGDFYQAQTVIYWDPQTQEQVGALPPHLVSSMALSPDGNILATATDNIGTINLWNVAEQSQVGQIQVPNDVTHLTFSPDGKIVASSGFYDNMIRLWDIQTLSQIATLSRDEGAGLRRGGSLAFSMDGRLLVIGGGRIGTHHITLWDVETLNQVGELAGHLDYTTDLAFNPNSTILASAGGWEDKAVYLWNIRTLEQIGVLGGHSAHVGTIDFSPDGTLLASTSFWDDSIYLWDVKGQVLIGKLNGHDATDFGWNDQVDISSDGKWLACGSENGVELWEANLPGAVPQTSAYGPLPRDGSIHDDTWATLSWLPGIYADSHDVYIGDNFDDVNEGIDEAYCGNQTSTFFLAGFPGYPYPEGLVPGTTYYWRIDEVNDADPNSPWKGPVWSLTIPSYEAFNPVPADGADSVELDVVLSWEAGFGAILHTMYFSDNLDDVVNVTEGLQLTQTTYAPEDLESGKTYYWRVDEFDGIETHAGDIWNFTISSSTRSIKLFAKPNKPGSGPDYLASLSGGSWDGVTAKQIWGIDITASDKGQVSAKTATMNPNTSFGIGADAIFSDGQVTGIQPVIGGYHVEGLIIFAKKNEASQVIGLELLFISSETGNKQDLHASVGVVETGVVTGGDGVTLTPDGPFDVRLDEWVHGRRVEGEVVDTEYSMGAIYYYTPL